MYMLYLAVPYISSSLTFCMFIDSVETGFVSMHWSSFQPPPFGMVLLRPRFFFGFSRLLAVACYFAYLLPQ